MRYFHRNVDGHASAGLLKIDGRDGAFLARSSARGASGQNYAVSVLWGGVVYHVAVVNGGDFYEIVGLSEKFASIADLVEHCTGYPDIFKGGGEGFRMPPEVKLLHPLPSSQMDEMNELWMHENLVVRQDAERLVLDNGVAGSFLVRPSKSQPENFVFTIKTASGKIVHVPIKGDKDNHFCLNQSGAKYSDLRQLVEKCREPAGISTSMGAVNLDYPLSRTAFRAEDVQSVVDRLGGKGGGVEGEEDFEAQFYDLTNDSDVEVVDGRLRRPNFAASSEEEEVEEVVEEEEESSRRRKRKTLTLEAAGKKENKGKNRYKNILPFDQTRVKLGMRTEGGGEGGEGEEEEEREAVSKKKEKDVANLGKQPPSIPKKSSTLTSPSSSSSSSSPSIIPTADYINANWIRPPVGDPFVSYEIDSAAPPRRCYVATQGPLAATERDFWRMIVETDSRVIVMLTKVKEKEKIKCAQYWPKSEEEEKVYAMEGGLVVGGGSGGGSGGGGGGGGGGLKRWSRKKWLRVRLLNTEWRTSHYVVRELEWEIDEEEEEEEEEEGGGRGSAGGREKENVESLYVNANVVDPSSSAGTRSSSSTSSSSSSSSSRTKHRQIVYHYHFVGWPDAGVPSDPAGVLDYLWDARLRQVKAGPSAGPMTVHCSAGIGRTGTFVALDCLLTELTKGGPSSTPLDVQRLVKILRRQRFGMVQTLDQFRFVYEALSVHIEAALMRRAGVGGGEADAAYSNGDEEVRRNYENVQY